MPPPCAVESHVPCYLLSGSAFSSQREPPRGKPVASKERSADFFSSNERETPPDKPVASLRVFSQSLPRGGTDLIAPKFRGGFLFTPHLKSVLTPSRVGRTFCQNKQKLRNLLGRRGAEPNLKISITSRSHRRS